MLITRQATGLKLEIKIKNTQQLKIHGEEGEKKGKPSLIFLKKQYFRHWVI